MASKADFNAVDWETIVDGPLYAGMRVASAERGGTLKETVALGRVYQEARAHQGESPLLDELVASPAALDPARLQRAGGDLEALTTAELRKAVAILQRTATPTEIDAYKTFVMTVAQAVANAHREGGFLGIGGRAVSAAEDAALDEISLALGDPPGTA